MKSRKLSYCIFLLLTMQLIFLCVVVQDGLSSDKRSFKDIIVPVKSVPYFNISTDKYRS
jgi:hypothetical protein